MLATASFDRIRTRLESQAIAMLRAGKTQVEAEQAILGLEQPGAVLADGADLTELPRRHVRAREALQNPANRWVLRDVVG